MKGTFFQKPLEFNLITDAESWRQGEVVKGRLVVRSHGAGPVTTGALRVRLVEGDIKKVRQRSDAAWDVIESRELSGPVTLAPSEEKEFPWEFTLTNDAPISDTMGSLFLLYGDSEDAKLGGDLQLTVSPRPMIGHVMGILETFFRFKIGALKFKKGWVEIKLTAPSSREYANVDAAYMYIRHVGEVLELRYVFTISSIAMENGISSVKKTKKEFEQVMQKRQYDLYKGSPNPEGIQRAIEEIVSQVRAKVMA